MSQGGQLTLSRLVLAWATGVKSGRGKGILTAPIICGGQSCPFQAAGVLSDSRTMLRAGLELKMARETSQVLEPATSQPGPVPVIRYADATPTCDGQERHRFCGVWLSVQKA